MDTALLFDNAIVLLPEIVLAVGVMLLLLVDIGRRSQNGASPLPALTVVILLLSLGASLLIWRRPPAEYLGGAVSDGFALSVRLIILVAGIFGVLLSRNYLPAIERQGGAYYSLLVLAVFGMMLMGTATNLIVLFIALEIFSLALYILSGFYRESARSIEAAMKYFLLGAFASTFFVYGAALLYGAFGSTSYVHIHNTFSYQGISGSSFLILPGVGDPSLAIGPLQQIDPIEPSVQTEETEMRGGMNCPHLPGSVNAYTQGRVHRHGNSDQVGFGRLLRGELFHSEIDSRRVQAGRAQGGQRPGQAERLMAEFVAGDQ